MAALVTESHYIKLLNYSFLSFHLNSSESGPVVFEKVAHEKVCKVSMLQQSCQFVRYI